MTKSTPASADKMRRKALAALATLGLGVGWIGPARAAKAHLPLSQPLPDELARALRQGQPLVVMVSLHPCPWCDEVRGNYLGPMHSREGLAVVQLVEEFARGGHGGEATARGVVGKGGSAVRR